MSIPFHFTNQTGPESVEPIPSAIELVSSLKIWRILVLKRGQIMPISISDH